MPRSRAFLLCLAAIIYFISFAGTPAASLARAAAKAATAPEISARAAIVVEYPSGRILYAKSEHDRVSPASTTKILTAILALEHGKLDDLVTVAPTDLVRGSKMGLKSGERQTMRNLLYGLLLPSGNDSANAIARYLGSQGAGEKLDAKAYAARFIEMMNARVAQLKLKDSHFANPHGLDARGHYSSAYDLASLTWIALHYPDFNQIVRQDTYEAPGHSLRNVNKLLTRYQGADGVKTGWTGRAGLCLVSSATRNGKRLITVVLNAPKWYDDSTALLDYGFARLATLTRTTGFESLLVARSTVVAQSSRN
jgi:serine-type D-Ala-D-Ala carboxypeptidase (penicillin-binding protein 5/6)